MSFRGVVSSPPHDIARAHHRKERRNRTHECSKRQTSKSSKSHLDALRVRPSRGWRFIRRDKLLRANDNRRRVSAVLQLPFRGQECRGARGDGLTRGVMHRRMFPGYIYFCGTKKWRREGRERAVGRCGGECARNHVALGSWAIFFYQTKIKTKHLTAHFQTKKKRLLLHFAQKKTKKMVDVSPKEGNILFHWSPRGKRNIN